jgi:hypothetical protein
MPKRVRRDLPGLALVVAIPLIPGLAILTAAQPSAPGCAPAHCTAVPAGADSPHLSAANLISRAGFIPCGPVRPAALPVKGVTASTDRASRAAP